MSPKLEAEAPPDPNYPSYRYKADPSAKATNDLPAGVVGRVVQSADEDAALGPGWYDSPKKALHPPKKAKD